MPVSYTHLDVYKRQVFNKAAHNGIMTAELAQVKRFFADIKNMQAIDVIVRGKIHHQSFEAIGNAESPELPMAGLQVQNITAVDIVCIQYCIATAHQSDGLHSRAIIIRTDHKFSFVHTICKQD